MWKYLERNKQKTTIALDFERKVIDPAKPFDLYMLRKKKLQRMS